MYFTFLNSGWTGILKKVEQYLAYGPSIGFSGSGFAEFISGYTGTPLFGSLASGTWFYSPDVTDGTVEFRFSSPSQPGTVSGDTTTILAINQQPNSSGYPNPLPQNYYTTGNCSFIQINSSGKLIVYAYGSGAIWTSTNSYNDGLAHFISVAQSFNSKITGTGGSFPTIWNYSIVTYTAGSTTPTETDAFTVSTQYGYSFLPGLLPRSIRLGEDDIYPTNHFAGRISQVRLWNFGRTTSQVAANYRNQLVGNETNLGAYWPLDDGTGTTGRVLGNNSNKGVLTFQPTTTWGPPLDL